MAVASALAAVALVASLALGATAIARTASGADGVSSDFLSFYAAGRMVRTGDGDALFDAEAQAAAQGALYPGEIEEPIGYPLPVFAAWMFVPFSILPFGAAYLAWLAVNAGALALVCAMLWRLLHDVPARPRALFVAAAATSLPVVATMAFGQVDLLLVALLLGAWLALRRGHSVAAGVALALCLMKPQFVAGILLLLLAWREWRTLAAFTFAGTSLLVVPALVTSPGALEANARYITQYPGTSPGLSVNAETMPNWRGFVTSATGSGDAWLWVPGFALVAIAAMAVAYAVSRRGTRGDEQSFAVGIMLPLLLTPHLHTQSLILLVISGALAWRAYFARGNADASVAMAWALGVYFALFAAWFAAAQGLALGAFVVIAAFAWIAVRWPRAESAHVDVSALPLPRAA